MHDMHRLNELTKADLPLRVYGRSMCSRCAEVQELLRRSQVPYVYITLTAEELTTGLIARPTRHESASVLTILTWQDGLLPVVLTATMGSFIEQDVIEGFLQGRLQW